MLISLRLSSTLATVLNIKVISTLLAPLANAVNQLLQMGSKLVGFIEVPNEVNITTTAKTPILIEGSATNNLGTEAEVVTYHLYYDGHNIAGKVLNQTGKTVNSLKLHYNYEIISQQLKVTYGGTIFVNEVKLLDSQTSTFQSTTQPNGTNLKIQSAEWVDN